MPIPPTLGNFKDSYRAGWAECDGCWLVEVRKHELNASEKISLNRILHASYEHPQRENDAQKLASALIRMGHGLEFSQPSEEQTTQSEQFGAGIPFNQRRDK